MAGGVLRYMHDCNWKMLVENQTDTCHPMIAHQSSAGTAIDVWKSAPAGAKKPMAVEIYAPFMSSYEFFQTMGIRVWDNGHGHTGVSHSIHSDYSAVPGYFEQMVAAYGEERAKAILDENRHNTVYFPNVMLKGPIQLLRLFKPIAANKTLVESWTYRLVDAPDMLLERTVMYNRLINAPTSVVGHDDLEVYERAQAGLASNGNEWVNVQRLYDADETGQRNVVTDGTSEWQMRNQFRAWAKFMTMSRPVTGDEISEPAPTDQQLDRFRHRARRGCSTSSGWRTGSICSPRTATTGCRRMGPDRSAAHHLADVRRQAAAAHPHRPAQGQARLLSQSPKSRCHHMLQMPQVDERDDGERHYVTWTPMHYVESRADEQTLYAAWATHTSPWSTARSKSA